MDLSKMAGNNPELRSFVNFLKTGELGSLNLSLKVADIYTLLGKPKDSFRPFKGTDQDHLLNLQYKNLAITFYDDDLAIYIIQFQNGFKAISGGLPTQLHVSWFSTVKKMSFEEFLQLVKTSDLHCLKLVTDDAEDQHFRFPDSGVEVNFDLHIRNGIYQIDCSRSGPGNRQFEEIL